MQNSLNEDRIAELKRQQQALATQVRVLRLEPFLAPSDLLLALDIQYEGDQAFVGAALQSWDNTLKKQFAYATRTDMPYYPGLFCFREGPPLQEFIKALRSYDSRLMPRLVLVDGQGLAHPRGFGVACWLGLTSGIATLGCAKSSLLPYTGELAQEAGSTLGVYLNARQVGTVLRRKTGINPVFVSVGHGVNLRQAEEVLMGLPSDYRLPDLLREADQNARALAKQELPASVLNLTAHHIS